MHYRQHSDHELREKEKKYAPTGPKEFQLIREVEAAEAIEGYRAVRESLKGHAPAEDHVDFAWYRSRESVCQAKGVRYLHANELLE
jgi:hypothetical protein